MIHFTPPPVWHLGGSFFVNIHSLAFCAGALTAYFWTTKRLPKELKEHVDNLALWMTLGGILGARLLFAVVNYRSMHSLWQIFAFWEGGLISYGGFLGAILAWIVYIRLNKLPMPVMCHAMGPAALLGWGIGRLGCFFAWNGEIGTPTQMPWGFIVGEDVPRHPVMLYLALAHCTCALLAAKYSERLQINGAALSLIAFGLVRAILDYWRDYNPAWLYQGSLAISALWVIFGLLLLKYLPYPPSSLQPELPDGLPDSSGNQPLPVQPKFQAAETASPTSSQHPNSASETETDNDEL